MKLMTSSIFSALRRIRWSGFLCLVVVLLSQAVQAERCDPAPGSDYEKTLCTLKRTGKGDALPNIDQFRENSPIVQALILKRTAARAGIMIKMPERDNQEALRRQDDLLLAKPVVATNASSQPARTTVAPVTVTKETLAATVGATAVTTSLSNCSLDKLSFQCPDGRYQLIGNQTNEQLLDNALSDHHKLGLPVYQGSPDDIDALNRYLAKAYDRYLSGMVEIGLGASTMSYTKFSVLYHYIRTQQLDFSARFETMYEFLKKDKATIGVNTQLKLADGFTPQYCSQLDHFLACDYGQVNYVFARQTMEAQ